MAIHKSPVPLGPASYKIRVIGAKTAWFRDAHHAFLRMPGWMGLLVLIAFFLFTNVLFAFAYAELGGVVNARPGSVIDGFYFSVQTMATIGYGYMYPSSNAAHVLVVTEAVLGLLLTALCAGLVFAKFSQPTGRITFSREVVIGPMDGIPTLMFRVGNERGNQIVEATIRVAIVRTVRTREGQVFYRMTDLPLVRDRSPAMTRSWNVMHSISDGSPLHGYDPERMASEELELIVSLVGVDDTSYQPVHARHQYEHRCIVWGARHADVLSEADNGDLIMDIRKFHEVVPTEPLPSFPYPRPKPPAEERQAGSRV